MFNKKIAGNFISLSVVQGLNYLFPLIVFPVLLRKLGVEGFGLFTLIQVLIMYADLFVSFGFGLTATKHVSKHQDNKERTDKIIVSVYIIKILLLLSVFLVLGLTVLTTSFIKEDFFLILISLLYPLGNLLFPDWLYQGIQKMRTLTIVTLISKCISLILIFSWVKSTGDVIWAIAAISAGNFLAGVIGFFLMHIRFKPKWNIPEKKYMLVLFKESAVVFSGIVLVPLYSSINIFILHFFSNALMVGYYAIAEKIFNAFSMVTSIANRTFYPHLSRLYKTSIEEFRTQVNKINRLFLISFLIFAICQFVFAPLIIEILSGKNEIQDVDYTIEVLKIVSIAVFFSPYGSYYFQLLIIQGRKKTAVRNIFLVVVINLFSACTLAYFYEAKGMAVNLCLIVFFIATFNYLSFHKKRLN